MAFSLDDYTALLLELRAAGYGLGPVCAWWDGTAAPFIFLKHDVDRLPGRAVRMAHAERRHGIASTYYFRCDRHQRFPREEIREIAALGHETGFHYESVSRARGNLERARDLFERELASLREIAPVRTVAAHGSPLSRHSNMGQSADMDLERLGLLGEPCAHIDFSRVVYITDTGGVFGSPCNVRDRVQGRNWDRPAPPAVIARMLRPAEFQLILMNTHPERWPSGGAGLLQARLTDQLANLAKRTAQALRKAP